MRCENMDKSDVITRMGNCPNCRNIPFTVNICRIFELFWFFSEFYFLVGKNPKVEFNRELLDKIVNNSKTKDEIFIQKERCSVCKKNDLKIFFSVQKNTGYDEIFIYRQKYDFIERIS